MKTANTEELRRLLVPVLNTHAERLRIGEPTNRDRLLFACIDQLPSLLDEVDALKKERDTMRTAIMAACRLQIDRRDDERHMYAIRETANYLGAPFTYERVQEKYDEYAAAPVVLRSEIEGDVANWLETQEDQDGCGDGFVTAIRSGSYRKVTP